MPVSSPYVLQALDAKEAALAFLLKKGNKRVLWDSCELMWDPYELLGQRAKKQNQVRPLPRVFRGLNLANVE